LQDGRTVVLKQAYAHNPDLVRARFLDAGESQVIDVILSASIKADAALLEELYAKCLGQDVNEDNLGYVMKRETPVTIETLIAGDGVTGNQKFVGGVSVATGFLTFLIAMDLVWQLYWALLSSFLGGFAILPYLVTVIYLYFFTPLIKHVVECVWSFANWTLGIFWPAKGEVGGIRRIASGVVTAVKTVGTGVVKAATWVGSKIKGFFTRPTMTIQVAAI
jgi:hypothetical protein